MLSRKLFFFLLWVAKVINLLLKLSRGFLFKNFLKERKNLFLLIGNNKVDTDIRNRTERTDEKMFLFLTLFFFPFLHIYLSAHISLSHGRVMWASIDIEVNKVELRPSSVLSVSAV